MSILQICVGVWLLVVLGFAAWAFYDLHTFDRKRGRRR